MNDIIQEEIDRPATRADLLTVLKQLGAKGYHKQIDDLHTATFVPRNNTLLVSFEEIERSLARDTGLPVSYDFVDEKNWSLLHITSSKLTWFRSEEMFRFFDDLSDDVFFDEYEQVIFYGAGSGGFAAAAYSVTSPGARIIAIEPQGAIGPDRAGWDDRFRASFPTRVANRYAYPPDLAQAAERAFIVFDPARTFDHIHASLYQGENVTHVRAHNMGGDPDTPLDVALEEVGTLHPLIESLATRDVSRAEAHHLLRARHHSMPWTIALLEEAARQGHTDMALRCIDSIRSRDDRIELRQLRRRVRAVHRGFDEDL